MSSTSCRHTLDLWPIFVCCIAGAVWPALAGESYIGSWVKVISLLPRLLKFMILYCFLCRPVNMIAQSQSGTGKTAAFVLTMLSRVDISQNYPQVGEFYIYFWVILFTWDTYAFSGTLSFPSTIAKNILTVLVCISVIMYHVNSGAKACSLI